MKLALVSYILPFLNSHLMVWLYHCSSLEWNPRRYPNGITHSFPIFIHAYVSIFLSPESWRTYSSFFRSTLVVYPSVPGPRSLNSKQAIKYYNTSCTPIHNVVFFVISVSGKWKSHILYVLDFSLLPFPQNPTYTLSSETLCMKARKFLFQNHLGSPRSRTPISLFH